MTEPHENPDGLADNTIQGYCKFCKKCPTDIVIGKECRGIFIGMCVNCMDDDCPIQN